MNVSAAYWSEVVAVVQWVTGDLTCIPWLIIVFAE